jgi:hypothetical protein
VQVAITVGAAGGGAIYDFKGASAVFGASSLVLFAAALMAFSLFRRGPMRPPEAAAGAANTGRSRLSGKGEIIASASSAYANSFSLRHRRCRPGRLPAASSRLECPGANAIK